MKSLRSILRRDPIRTHLSIVILSALAVSGVACDDDASPTNDRVGTDLGGGAAGAEVTEAGRDAGGDAGESAMVEGANDTAGEDVGGAAGEGAGAEDAGESQPAGETPEPAEPPSCLTSCAEFVGCAIKQCPGYDEPDDALLMEECLSLCTPAIAELFSRVEGCAEQLQFAATVRTDFLDFCDSASEGFCETYIATCGEWLGDEVCEDHYNLAPAEGPQPNYGANQRCYEYHLGSAMVALDNDDEEGVTLGCERAAGLAMCIDE